MEKFEFEVVVEDCALEVDAIDLANFITQLRRSYINAYAFVQLGNSERGRNGDFVRRIVESANDDPGINQEFINFLSEYRFEFPKYSHVFSHNRRLPPEIELSFSRISKNSPLAFMGYCTGTAILALAIAVALAGGEVDLIKNKFKVNSLLDAIRKWR